MKRNILMAALVAALFTTVTFAQTTPVAATPSKPAKMEKKANKASVVVAKNEDKKMTTVDKKGKKMMHKKAKHTKVS